MLTNKLKGAPKIFKDLTPFPLAQSLGSFWEIQAELNLEWEVFKLLIE